jgi:ParB family chromosome partitioning protein
MTTRRIDEIVVGERHRRDLGDIDLADLGLLQPIVIRPDDRLLVGHRRLASRQGARLYRGSGQRGRSRRHGERLVRRERPEAVAIKRALEPIERAAAKERQHDHAAPGRNTPEKQTWRPGRITERRRS